MKLTIAREVYQNMLESARKAAPMEACGLLGGMDEHATQFYKLTNVDASPEHFSMKPEEQFAAVKDMRARGLRMLAIWHSHPISLPRMSKEDLRLAFTSDVAYVIVSLLTPEQPQIAAYVIRDGRSEEINVVVGT